MELSNRGENLDNDSCALGTFTLMYPGEGWGSAQGRELLGASPPPP